MSQYKGLDLLPYIGRWVAIVSGRVAGSGRSPSQARYMAARVYPKERCQLGWVTEDIEGEILMLKLPLPKITETLRLLINDRLDTAAAGSSSKVYIVGGALRDALLGRTSHDLDLAMQQDAVPLGRWIADQLGGSFYHLDPERGTGRVILPGKADPSVSNGERILVDLALFREGSLIDDLKHRDFTINAMAIPIESDDPAQIIDPLGGQADLADRIIRVTGPDAIRDDPVRSLRAVRQSTELSMQIHQDTKELIRQDAYLLPKVAAERVRDELFRILSAPDISRSFRLLNELGLEVLPELAQPIYDNVNTSPELTMLDHSIPVVITLEQLLASIIKKNKVKDAIVFTQYLEQAHRYLYSYAAYIENHLYTHQAGDRNIRSTLFFAALLHPGQANRANSVSNHRNQPPVYEQLASNRTAHRARELSLSNQEVKYVSQVVGRQNYLTHFLAIADESPSRISIYRYFRDTVSYGLDVCLLGLARRLNETSSLSIADWKNDLSKVSILLDHYFHHYQETISPPPLLDGYDLMKFLKLEPGPRIGQLLEIIREGQINNTVNTIDDALELVNRISNESSID
ncbi:MAG: CCA tRNA nucleotidyltransferase [Anaerolineales bacterium]|nr:CCA tRNA nucleotidyltransferase [Anaerolineales bacterium]